LFPLRPSKKKQKRLNTGLRNDWDQQTVGENNVIDGEDIQNAPLYARASSTSSGILSLAGAMASAPATSDGEEVGGISDDAGEVDERMELVEDSKGSRFYYAGNSKLVVPKVRFCLYLLAYITWAILISIFIR
jgi:hypothetical protein